MEAGVCKQRPSNQIPIGKAYTLRLPDCKFATFSRAACKCGSYRDLLQRHPDAIHPLTSLCNLVAGDNLTDGPKRMALVTGKANSDVRPIVTEEPLWHYIGHLLARTYRPTIQTVIGPNQYMHLSGGSEIVAHTIRALLESDSSLVVGKVDCCNAFNAIHKHPIRRPTKNCQNHCLHFVSKYTKMYS